MKFHRFQPDNDSFLRTLRRQPASRIPVAELGVHPTIKAAVLGHAVSTLEDEVEFALQAGYDYVKIQPAVDFDPGGANRGAGISYNPDGSVFRRWASEGTGVIATMEELGRFRFPQTEEIDYSRMDRVRRLVPDGMGVIGQYGDIFTMTWEMMGFEAFSIAVHEQPELVDALNRRLGELVVGMFEAFASSDAVDALWYSDDIAYTEGLMVSPAILDRYFFPWLRAIGDLARESGKPLIYHSDGVLYRVMDRIADCGVDALHPIEPKAMDLAEVKTRFGHRFCLIGGVDVDLLARGTPDEVREVVRRNIEAAGTGGGYCVGSGNSIPEYVSVENYLAMLSAAREFGDR
jgi:uroporphyrinogen decarboxylase